MAVEKTTFPCSILYNFSSNHVVISVIMTSIMKNNDVVILIPSYEPDHYLVDTVKKLTSEGFPILVVNDGSSSEYDEIFNKVQEHASYIKYDVNRGKGNALKEGYKNIPSLFPDAKYVITADGDGQHSIKDIKKCYELLKENDELILGVRKFDSSVPFKSRNGNFWSRFNRGLLTKQYVEDDQCGLRGFPIRYIPELLKIRGHRFEYEMNQLTSFQLRDYKIITFPIDVIYIDSNRKTHFQAFRDTIRIHLKIIIPGLPALFCLGLTIAGLITLYHFNFNYYHLMVFPVYLLSALIYVCLLDLIQPSLYAGKRCLKEIMYTLVKMSFVFLMMFILIDAFGLTFYISIPLLAILAPVFNLILPRIFK